MSATTTLTKIFKGSTTDNGDKCYTSTGNVLLDILFMTEYYQTHLNEVPYTGQDEKAKLFSMLIRDPRFGIGKRDLGRILMRDAQVSFEDIVKAGRYDDIWAMFHYDTTLFHKALDFLKAEIESGNELAKKWMPRYSSKNLQVAREIAKYWHMNKQTYGHFIKANSTVEQKLSRHQDDSIKFEHVPSLANLKYANTFRNKETLAARYAKYMEDVRSGKKDMHVSVATPYDLYKNARKLGKDVDTFFDKFKPTYGNWLPIVDTSASMTWEQTNDAFGKALAIGHYLAKYSTYAPNKVVSFSSYPQLLTLGVDKPKRTLRDGMPSMDTQYGREIASMYTGDCSNTDFGAVMELLKQIDAESAPEYLIILSDMQFDRGSNQSKEETMQMFRQNGINTKIIWWNLCGTGMNVCPETDQDGNIFLSGYNPFLLSFLESGFDGNAFLDKLLYEYKQYLQKNAA